MAVEKTNSSTSFNPNANYLGAQEAYMMLSTELYLQFAECRGAANCCAKGVLAVETYLKYAEAVGLTQSAAVP